MCSRPTTNPRRTCLGCSNGPTSGSRRRVEEWRWRMEWGVSVFRYGCLDLDLGQNTTTCLVLV
jgi:hypothetical protein